MMDELYQQWIVEDEFYEHDGIDMEVTRESLLTLQVCADSPDGEAVAEAITAVRPPGTSNGHWYYMGDRHVPGNPTVECGDHEGRYHHLMYC